MKASELRIGNWVRHNSEWCYKRGDSANPNIDISEFEFQWDDRDWYALGELCIDLENISPIPLSPEWLEKFGFHKCNISSYLDIGMDFSIAYDGEDGIYICAIGMDYNYYTNIEYVHQLQNLYFALTGEELNAS